MTRVLAALALVAVVLTTIWWLPPWATPVLAAVAAAMAGFELAGLGPSGRAQGPPLQLMFAVPAALFCLAFAVMASSGVPHAIFVVLMASMVAMGTVRLVSGPPAPIPGAALGLMALVYVGLPLGALARIQLVYGPRVLSVLLALVAVSDSAQYYSGRAFGRRKLAPSISPAKTIEGAIGGLVAASLVGALLGSRWIPGVSLAGGAVLGLILGGVGIVGDLFESLMKRGAGVKDSSHLIPGHGGVLDRIDSWLFAGPVYYIFLRYLA